MKVAIFGPTGGMGRCLLKQALEAGHRVTAFARTPAALAIGHHRLSIVQGDVFDEAAVERTVAGHDAVLCALGSRTGEPVCSQGTLNVVRAMREHGVRRLVCASAYGVADSLAGAPREVKELVARFLHRTFAEKAVQERVVRASGLDWVIVRAVGLNSHPGTGSYRGGVDLDFPAGGLPYISRADAAAFMLRQLVDDTFLRQAPTVASLGPVAEPPVREQISVAFRAIAPAAAV